jgi:ABC-type Fe3+/spermidine/putrescine transport system ATPase subunit
VFENVAFALRVRHVAAAEIRTRVLESLDMVRLSGLEARMPHQLSGGQQQRVAFARAIVFRPRVLLLDEPLGALDKKLREHMQLEIKQLQRRLQVTVIYITHDQEEALTMSDRVAVMNLGRVEQMGTPADLYERPANRFVATFLGESNFLAGTVAGTDDGFVRINTEDGAVTGQSTTCFANGDRVAIALRPEHVWLGDPPTPGHSNRVTGTISDTIYAGDAVRYRVRIASGLELTAKLPRRFTERAWERGEAVTASWRPGDATLFRES